MEEILNFIKAGYSHFYVQTQEPDRAIAKITDLVKTLTDYEKEISVWSLSQNPQVKDVMTIIDQAKARTVFILKNFNWVLNERSVVGRYCCDIIQAIQDRLIKYRSKDQRKILIILSAIPMAEGLPKELQNEFFPITLDRPNKDELREIYRFVLGSAMEADSTIKNPAKDLLENIVDSARGMTETEAENSFAYAFIKSRILEDHPKIIAQLRAKIIENVAGLKQLNTEKTFADVIGLDMLKETFMTFCGHPYSKGLMMIGPPGNGKTLFGESAGNAKKMLTFTVEFANIFGSLLGETYEKMSNLISVIKALGKCIILVDEIEKGMAGVGARDSGGTTGNEVTKRAMAMWLKFMSEPHECYIIATCNDISAFRGSEEYLRAQRWDCAPFFVDLPNIESKKKILDYYKKLYKVDGDPGGMFDWSGAEIESVCRIAAMMKKPLDVAAQLIIPIGKIMGKENLDAFRDWAERNAISATRKVVEGKTHKKRDISLEE